MFYIGIDPAKLSGYVLLKILADGKPFIYKVGKVRLTPDIKTNIGLVNQVVLLMESIVGSESAHVAMEDQHSAGNVNTVKSLVMTRTMYHVRLLANEWDVTLLHPSSWRSTMGFRSRKRAEVKKEAKKYVKDMFGLDLSEDASEAVCMAMALWAKEQN